jgi:uncharacterized membrane protein (DUF373 family)
MFTSLLTAFWPMPSPAATTLGPAQRIHGGGFSGRCPPTPTDADWTSPRALSNLTVALAKRRGMAFHMMQLIANIERWVVLGLLVLMLLVVVASSIELAIIIVQAALENHFSEEPAYLLLDINELLGIFGFFLLVLIGLELLASVKMYLEDDIVHVELVMLIALIAVSRKIIVIDYAKVDGVTVLGIAALVLVLSVGYYLMKRSHEPS